MHETNQPQCYIIKIDSEAWEKRILESKTLYYPPEKAADFAETPLREGTRILLFRAWGPEDKQGIIAASIVGKSTTEGEFPLFSPN